ncbi:MAG: 16S rRNA (guanine(966)-N(2))-methyltransferase RsmD [Candidatus Omnitrophota bacterium]
MRIIGGKFRGRKIKQPVFKTTRPTKDRIREAVFNIISKKVPTSNVLDIFAGSGAYGMEALSRGAKKAVFVEKNRLCAASIKENVTALGLEEYARIIIKDAFKAVELLGKGKNKEKFDLVFSDPPYNTSMSKKTLIMINQYDILSPSGLLIIEHSTSESFPEAEGDVSLCKQKTYGNICISVFLRK